MQSQLGQEMSLLANPTECLTGAEHWADVTWGSNPIPFRCCEMKVCIVFQKGITKPVLILREENPEESFC